MHHLFTILENDTKKLLLGSWLDHTENESMIWTSVMFPNKLILQEYIKLGTNRDTKQDLPC